MLLVKNAKDKKNPDKKTVVGLNFLRLKIESTRPKNIKRAKSTSKCKNLELPIKNGSTENSNTDKTDLVKSNNWVKK